jgi:hypothetical protein
MGATLATLDVTAELSGSADLDRRHHPPLFEAQMIRVAAAAKSFSSSVNSSQTLPMQRC